MSLGADRSVFFFMQHLCLYFPPVRVDLAGMPDTPSISKDTHMTHIRSVNVPLARNLNLGQKKSSSRRQLGVSGQTVTSQHPWCEAPRANLVKVPLAGLSTLHINLLILLKESFSFSGF